MVCVTLLTPLGSKMLACELKVGDHITSIGKNTLAKKKVANYKGWKVQNIYSRVNDHAIVIQIVKGWIYIVDATTEIK